jgi:ribonucleotide reductase alpha subunit
MKDFYWLNEKSRTFLERGYLQNGQSPEVRIQEIADAAQAILLKDYEDFRNGKVESGDTDYEALKGFAEKFVGYMKKGYYSLASPVWANFGLKRGLPISCNGSYIGDDMGEILYKASEIGMMSKHGSGTSGYFGALRERGAKVSGGGRSSGPVHFMEIYDVITEVVSQSGVRRGNFAAYLPVEHPDIAEFLQIRNEGHAIQHMSIGVTVSDAWMESMISGDKDKRELWAKIIKKRFESGYPYIMFSDTVNNNAPQVYKDKGMKIHASNLCLTGDTLVQIRVEGEELTVRMKDLDFYMDKPVEVKSFDIETGKDVYSSVKLFSQTGESTEIIEIEDEQGNVIKCTPEHKIYTQNRGYVEAQDLKEDDILRQSANGNASGLSERFINTLKIKRYTHVEAVYDITVEKTENFFANNILVHNCSEIALASDRDESFVCDLGSMNLLHAEEWMQTDAVEVFALFLDAVMSEYIDKVKGIRFMEAAYRFAVNQRALGMGTLGWHSFLQSKSIAFESFDAKMWNVKISKFLAERNHEANKVRAVLFGEPPLLKGYGLRNVTTMAIAPTTSSSFILGQVSPSIEPLNSNYFVKDLAKGKFTYKNPYLKEVLKKHSKDTQEVWQNILIHDGSVQHLDFLTDNERDVFKTFGEISQKEIIIQAAQRQKYIDQSQSINLMIHPKASVKEVNALLIEAWKLGVKTLYYQRSTSPAQELGRSILACKSCEA